MIGLYWQLTTIGIDHFHPAAISGVLLRIQRGIKLRSESGNVREVTLFEVQALVKYACATLIPDNSPTKHGF
jgi:hypothetical protein